MIKFRLFILIFLFVSPVISGQTDSLPADTLVAAVKIDSIAPSELNDTLDGYDLIARYDSLVQLNFLFENDTIAYPDTTRLPAVLPPDSVVRKRIEALNEQTPMELYFSPYVKNFIKLYAGKKRSVTEKTMGLAELYFPVFEEMLDRYEIPLELKYLPIVESALNPRARSRVGATGLWQFMYYTGKKYGLEINSYIDERRDPYLATEAACRYLKFLHDIYGDWTLALAAYNSGPGNVNKAIRRSGGKKTFREIRRYLPRETRGYVPAFIAINYIFNYPEDYNLKKRPVNITFNRTDTVHVNQRVIFEYLGALTGVDKEMISFLNPMYRRQVVPKAPEGENYAISLPVQNVAVFILNADSIFSKSAIEHPELEIPEQNADLVIHRVRSGEVLGTIARRYHVRVSDIQEWNNLRGTRIYAGQKLTIYTNKPPSKAPAQKSKPPKQTLSDDKYIYHVVRDGDTLWDIAKEYNGVTVDQIIELNKGVNTKKLKPGQKIKVAVKQNE